MQLNNCHGARYQRQVLVPEIGQEGQERINKAKIFLLGAGGLASAAAYYLSAAGIGTLGICDDDCIEISNLNRQILHCSNRIGMPKVLSARRTLASFNPDTHLLVYPTRLSSAIEMAQVIEHFDAVVDCTDNFAARALINESCILAKKPWIYGAVSGFEGQIMTILPGGGPCYRCLYPAPPPASGFRQTGVVGVSPGAIGVFQAAEIIKYILGKGNLLVGRMLYIDLLEMHLSELIIPRNPSCQCCSKLTLPVPFF
jgi:molybdopterin-synthase adenylyltransferase